MSKETTDEIFLIAASDYLLDKAQRYGRFEFNKIMAEFDRKPYKLNIAPKDEVIFYNYREFSIVASFMEEEGYIKSSGNAFAPYELTDLGREIKKHGGQTKYFEFIDKKESTFFESVRYAKEAAGAAIESATAAKKSTDYSRKTMVLIAIYTFLTLVLVVTTIVMCNQNSQPKVRQSNATNSHTETKAKSETDTIK